MDQLKRAFTFLVAVLVASCWAAFTSMAVAQDRIPERIADLPYKRASRFEDPRLGMVLVYERDQTETLSIYVYNLGLETIPKALESEVVVSQFRQAQSDIAAAETWQEVTLQSEEIRVLGADDSPLSAHEAVYVAKLQGRRMASYLYLLSTGRLFLKVRYSAPLETEGPAPPLPEPLRMDIGELFKSWMEPK